MTSQTINQSNNERNHTMTAQTTAKFNFITGDEGNLICRHRDLSCCNTCANEYDEIVDIYGKHFWIDDAELRAELANR